jgi:hypothetical protein
VKKEQEEYPELTSGNARCNKEMGNSKVVEIFIMRKSLFKKVLTKNATKLRKRTSRTVA